jgi:hypothetical protein
MFGYGQGRANEDRIVGGEDREGMETDGVGSVGHREGSSFHPE